MVGAVSARRPVPPTLAAAVVLFVAGISGSTSSGQTNGDTTTVPPTIKISKPTFTVDYERDEFLMDGQVFRFISGSLHYFRVPKPYWKDRIQKMKAAGLNAVSTYVEWSLHEPYPGEYNFEEMADLEYFLRLVKDEGMYVILRPGPYICAERDLGGFPFWLLNEVPKKRLRTNDPSYKRYIKKWFNVLMLRIDPFLYGNGGNIIMVQVENEYGSYHTCDEEYMLWLRDLYKQYVGNNALLYTTDGCGYSYFTCGAIPDVYATVDFGVLNKDVSQCFKCMRRTQDRGPLVNSEFYSGWLSHWGEKPPAVRSDDVIRSMKSMLALNASFNIYMFHGGTNFGFTSGANMHESLRKTHYMPQLTSYDYDAPLNEAGDPTEKYYKIKKLLEESNSVLKNMAVSSRTSPVPSPKGAYGKFTMQPVVSFFDEVTQRIKPIESDVPLSFENLGINSGFVMYETILTDVKKRTDKNALNLTISTIRDQASVYLDQTLVRVIPRKYENIPIVLNLNDSSERLSILVENQGRINYGKYMEDAKGIFEPVTLGSQTLGPWKMIPYPLNDTFWLSMVEPFVDVKLPAFYRTQFTLPDDPTRIYDTYLDMTGWKKGVAFINGMNLGRYWPSVGPQITLYVPATYLVPAPGVNIIVILELEGVPQDLSIALVDKSKYIDIDRR